MSYYQVITIEEARQVLDSVKDGDDVTLEKIRAALKATGDLSDRNDSRDS